MRLGDMRVSADSLAYFDGAETQLWVQLDSISVSVTVPLQSYGINKLEFADKSNFVQGHAIARSMLISGIS